MTLLSVCSPLLLSAGAPGQQQQFWPRLACCCPPYCTVCCCRQERCLPPGQRAPLFPTPSTSFHRAPPRLGANVCLITSVGPHHLVSACPPFMMDGTCIVCKALSACNFLSRELPRVQ